MGLVQLGQRIPLWCAMLAMVAVVLSVGLSIDLNVTGTGPGTAVEESGEAPNYASGAPEEVGVVQISTASHYDGTFQDGAGIVIDPTGVVLTASHVVASADSIAVTVPSSGRTFEAQLLGYDRHHDIAVLQLQDSSNLSTARIADSSWVAVGDKALGIGNSLGTGRSLVRREGSVLAIDHSSGQVIGVLLTTRGTWHAFAIPINQALRIAQQIESQVRSDTVHVGNRATLGIMVNGGGSDGGVVVREVFADLPASEIGLSAGDVITSIAGKPVRTPWDLITTLDRHSAGEVIELSWRDYTENQRSADVTLADIGEIATAEIEFDVPLRV